MYTNDNVDYARQRLVETIITYKGKAHQVLDVKKARGNKPLVITSTEVLSGDIINDDIDNYDLTPVKLGFVNANEAVGYIVRKPMRNDWRQGLRAQQVYIPYASSPNFFVDFRDVARTIEGIFPTIEEIYEQEKPMRAFSRDFSMNKAGEIYYRAFGKVGNFLDRTRNFLLDAKFFWVEERLKEVV
jgi:hypothetical protein